MHGGKEFKRKSMAAVGSVIGVPSDNWIENQATLVALWRKSNPFLDVNWEQPKWDVAESYESRKTGAQSNGKPSRLLFTQHSTRPRVDGEPLAGVFGDVVKSLVCARHAKRGQTVASHMVFVRATRYVYDTLKSCNHDISLTTPAHLDLAVKDIYHREAETSAYKVLGHMEEFADMLDANGLCKIRLDWRSHTKVRPRKLGEDRIEDAPPIAEPDDRLPKEEAIRALGWLYQNIPSEGQEDGVANPDRIAILIATLMVCTGLRIGECLTLPEHPILTERDGTRSLKYARLKGRRDHIGVEWKTNAKGKVVDIVKALPTDVATAFLQSRIQAVHDVGPGMCVHDYQMAPCTKHLQCEVNCDEYVWKTNDKERESDLLRQIAITQRQIRNVLNRKAVGEIVHSDWMRHVKTRYRQLLKQFKSLRLTKSDIERWIAESGFVDSINELGQENFTTDS